MSRRTHAIAVIALGLAGCRADLPPDPAAGTVEMRWRRGAAGAASGELESGGLAWWCEGSRLLELAAIRGDTGVGLVLFPADSLRAGTYRVRHPDSTARRPDASAAIRWFDTSTVMAFQGVGGSVSVERVGGGRISGRLAVRARVAAAGANAAAAAAPRDSLVLEGSFRDVPVQTGGRACGDTAAAGVS